VSRGRSGAAARCSRWEPHRVRNVACGRHPNPSRGAQIPGRQRTPYGTTAAFDIAAQPAGRLLAGAGAAVLLVSLFLRWFSDEGFAQSGWDAHDGDKLVGLFAVAALVVVGLEVFGSELALPLERADVLAACGALSLLVVVLRLVDQSRFGPGIWLALVASTALMAGGLLERAAARPRPQR
jgi:hypothetical protein